MHPIIYDVAVSIDGYISGPDGDISGFAHEGPVVDAYAARLQGYACALMGRATYEFGYRFGLEPGQNPYPHLRSYVLSEGISLPSSSEVTQVTTSAASFVKDLRATASGPIYLCGGGALAGSLLQAGLIDVLRLKRAPILLAGGTRLFGSAPTARRLEHRETQTYEGGYVFQEYHVKN